jgi:putative endonuclease
MEYILYLLINTCHNYTYIGITNNPNRRIRQHNGELVGGAKYTHNFKKDGEWIYYGRIENLSKSIALSLEKRIQIKSRKVKGKTPLERRLNAINIILSDPKYNNQYTFYNSL